MELLGETLGGLRLVVSSKVVSLSDSVSALAGFGPLVLKNEK